MVIFLNFVYNLYFAAMEIVVYFADGTGTSLSVDDGVNLTARELYDMVYEETGLPDSLRETFSLWLISDLLGEF